MSGTHLFIGPTDFTSAVKGYFGSDDSYAEFQSELAEQTDGIRLSALFWLGCAFLGPLAQVAMVRAFGAFGLFAGSFPEFRVKLAKGSRTLQS